MLSEILKANGLIKEATEIKKDSFKYFYIDEIKDVDTITDVTDLGDRNAVEILLTTEKNYNADKPSDGTWYKVNSEKLIKFMTKTVDKFEDGDYIDFMGGYGLTDLIVNYIESEFKAKHFKTWTDFVGVMEGDGKVNTSSTVPDGK